MIILNDLWSAWMSETINIIYILSTWILLGFFFEVGGGGGVRGPPRILWHNVQKLPLVVMVQCSVNIQNVTITSLSHLPTNPYMKPWIELIIMKIFMKIVKIGLSLFSTRPHQNVFWYNNSWLGFLKIQNYM